MTATHASAPTLIARPAVREGTSSAPTRGDDEHQQLAWQREMERAQLANWFKPQPHAQGRGQDASDTHAPTRPHGRERQRAAHAVHAMPSAPAAATPPSRAATSRPGTVASTPGFAQRQRAELIAPLAAHTAALCTSPTAEADSPLDPLRLPGFNASALAASPDAESTTPRRASCEPMTGSTAATCNGHATSGRWDGQSPVRVHNESMPSGQAIWIAMRADDQALKALLPQLVLDLQRAQALQGRHLHQVVCNGELVWRAGEFVARGSAHIPQIHNNLALKEI